MSFDAFYRNVMRLYEEYMADEDSVYPEELMSFLKRESDAGKALDQSGEDEQ